MKDTVEIIEGHIGILKGCISAEELQFVMNHLPGKVRCNIMKLPAKKKSELTCWKEVEWLLLPECNSFKLNRLWMIVVCKLTQIRPTVKRLMLTNNVFDQDKFVLQFDEVYLPMWFNTPECNLNWMMVVCKSMQVTRPMSANLYISSLEKN